MGYAKSCHYQKWEKEHLINATLRNLMCAVTGNNKDPHPVPERFNRAIGQVLAQSPDIVTFQELDHFGHFKRELKEAKYDGVFFQKEGSQAGRFNGQGYPANRILKGEKIGSDGAAIFWDNTLFKKIHDVQFNINMSKGKEFGQVCGRVILEKKSDGEKIAVYTAHMKSGGSDDKAKKHQANA